VREIQRRESRNKSSPTVKHGRGLGWDETKLSNGAEWTGAKLKVPPASAFRPFIKLFIFENVDIKYNNEI
jgi:hypothetical protein